jgi:Alginate export
MTARLLVASVTMIVWLAGAVVAQDAPAPAAPQVAGSLANVTRVETWRFFEPQSPGGDPDYTFFGNRSDLEITVRGARVDLGGGFSYVRIQELPADAIGPGGLGTGAFYYVASGLPYSYQVLLTGLTVSAHTMDRRWSFTAGRMQYTSGAEGENVATASSRLAAVRRLAVDGRLVGSFDWSFYRRRFDGGRVHRQDDRGYAGGGLFLVTQGGYEESANLTMTRLLVGTAYAGRRHGIDVTSGGAPNGESQAFAVLYRDRRGVDIRPDNAGIPVQAADITVGAVGASHVASRRGQSGELDYAGWGAMQFGDWYGQPHRAYAVAAQGGYRWSAAGKPWIRAGASYASGDADGRDDRHETFFPMLQETRSYADSMVYAHANLRDLFLQLHAEPHDRARLRVDVHRLDLARAEDRWYQGSGATAREGPFFGYSSRPSSGARGLGTVLEGSADVRLSRYWSVNAYAGRMWGGPVVRGIFDGDRLFYWYVENVLRLVLPRAASAPP